MTMAEKVVDLDGKRPKIKKATSVKNVKSKKITEMETEENVDARSLTLPVIAIIGLIGFFIWATWIGSNERNRLDNRIEAVASQVQTLANSINKLTEHITSSDKADKESWDKEDHVIWCLKAQIANSGWKCPEGEDDFKFQQLSKP